METPISSLICSTGNNALSIPCRINKIWSTGSRKRTMLIRSAACVLGQLIQETKPL